MARVYQAWGHLDDRPFRLLVYMANVARDKDAEPWFSLGHEALSELALGTPVPSDPAKRDRTLRVVRRAITKLHHAGAISTAKRATYGKKGVSNVRYRLWLDGPRPQDAQ